MVPPRSVFHTMEAGLKALKVAELKKILTDNGLDDKGKKEELVAVQPPPPLACIVTQPTDDPANNSFGGDFCRGCGSRRIIAPRTQPSTIDNRLCDGCRICGCRGGVLQRRRACIFVFPGPPKRQRWRDLPSTPPCPCRAVRLTQCRAPSAPRPSWHRC